MADQREKHVSPPQPGSIRPSSAARMLAELEIGTTSPVADRFDTDMDRLNARLRNAVAALNDTPGKDTVYVALPAAGAAIVFTRVSSGWALAYDDKPDDLSADVKPWDKCSIDEKLAIATALPELFRKLISKSTERRAKLKQAHDSLDKFEQLIRRGGEGA